jgi:hypothetical protein
MMDVGIQQVACVQQGGRSVVLAHTSGRPATKARSVVLAEQADGTWKASDVIPGVPAGRAALAFHPRWGTVLAFRAPRGREYQVYQPSFGPYVWRGPGLDRIGKKGPAPAEKAREKGAP